jgi:hypothetical protein
VIATIRISRGLSKQFLRAAAKEIVYFLGSLIPLRKEGTSSASSRKAVEEHSDVFKNFPAN